LGFNVRLAVPRRAAAFGACLLALVVLPAAGVADPGDIGFRGPHFSGTGSQPTGAKPESKLWFNDGFWWSAMFDEVIGDNFIYKLDPATQTWINTGVEIDNRSGVRADTLWDGSKLFVATHPYANHAQQTSLGARLYRYSYDAATDRYSLDAGFPATINNWRTEALVIAKDSAGRLWATWVQNATVFVNRTLANHSSWGTPFALPLPGAAGISTDDISSIIAFGGNQLGIMWSDQTRQQMHFAVHRDGTSVTSWTDEIALSGPTMADDHINLKADPAGRVYAATKTSRTQSIGDINLLVRATAGTWTKHLFSPAATHHTRPIVVLDTTNNIIHMFATADETGGTIYQKTTEFDNIAFPSGVGEPVLRDADNPDMNDVTSTKQNVTSATGLVVQASHDNTGYYWHNQLAVGALPLSAAFSGTPTAGGAPLTVAFSDLSQGAPTSWRWDFGDGTTSTAENPTHTYTSPGSYTVTLTIRDLGGNTKTATLTNFITVQPLAAGFTATPTSGAAPLAVAFTDTSTGDPIAWSWNFGDGTTSTLRNPSKTYTAPGSYTVSLTVTGKNGAATNTTTQTGYINALPLTADFTAAPTSGPAPLATTFTDTSIGAPTGWSWAFGDGATSTARNPSHTYASPGKYTVTLTVTGAGGATSTKTRTEYIDVLPLTADFTATPTFGAVPLVVNFADVSIGTATTWSWDFGDGGTSTQKNPSHTYAVPGTYAVTLTVTDALGATSTKTRTDLITVSADAVFATGADAYVSSNDPARNFGIAGSLRVRDGSTAPPHYVSYLKFDVAGLGASVTAAKLRLRVSDSGDDGGAVYLVGNGWTERGLTWANAPAVTGAPLASLGPVTAGSTVELELPRSVFAAGNGTYSFAIKSTNPFAGAAWYSSREGVAPAQLLLRVTSLPLSAAIGATPTRGGPPLTVNFSDLSEGVPTSWAWDFGDGDTSTLRNPTHTYTAVGNYTASLTVTDAGGNTSTKTVGIVVEPLAAEFSATPTSGPAPLATTFTDLSTGSPTSWAWDFGDGTTSTAQNPSHTYTAPGTYTVSLTVTDAAGGTNTRTRTAYVTAQALTADFTASPTFGTAPLVVAFTDATIGSPTSWAWSFGDGSTSTVQNPTHTFALTGTYSVSLTVTNAAGGTSTKTRTAYITASQSNVFFSAADSYVDSNAPTKNNGTAGSIRVRNGTVAPPNYVSYVKFNVTGLTTPVTEATLRLNVTDPGVDGGSIFVVDNGWTESGVNWTNAPVIGGTALATLGLVNLGTWVEVPLPASAFAAGNGTYSFAIRGNNPQGGAAWYSSREGVGAPQLVLR
jgi:trimeric autotransporter adhesin